MTAFDPRHPETWPLLLTKHHIAAIFGRSVRTVESAVKHRRKWLPPPDRSQYAWEWRRSQIEARVLGPVAVALKVRAR